MSWILTHLSVVAVSLLAVASAMVIVQQRRTPQATLAWLMFLVTVPYLAVPAFLVLGFRKQGADSRRGALFDATGVAAAVVGPGAGLGRLLAAHGLPPRTEGNTLRLLIDDGEAWDALLQTVESARERIDVTLYVLGDDEVGRAFCDRLTARAGEGVEVRVLLDWFGSLRRPRDALAALEAAGGEVRLCAPFLEGTLRRGRLNLRNHRKMVLADGRAVWAGGRNVADEYLGPVPLPDRWADLSFTVEGPVTERYARLFAADWAAAGDDGTPEPEPPPPAAFEAKGESPLQLVAAGPDIPEDPLHEALVHMFHTADRRIWIVTPYFLPTEPLIDALAIARRRGVDVRIMVPAKSNQILADLARGAYLRDLDRVGCRVCRYTGGMIHAKAMLMDDLALVGSANLDARSLLLNYEVMLLLSGAEDVAEVEAYMDDLLQGAAPGPGRSNAARRLVESLFRLGAPVL